MTRNAVHTPYTSRTHRVVTLCACLFLTTGAQAGAWEEFEARCLVPMENLFPSLVGGLNAVSLPGLAEGETAFTGLQGGAILILEQAPEDGFGACRVYQAEGPAVAKFESWADAQLASKRYVTDPEAGAGNEIALLSNMWVEPVIGVQMRRAKGGIEMRALETELES